MKKKPYKQAKKAAEERERGAGGKEDKWFGEVPLNLLDDVVRDFKKARTSLFAKV